MEEQGEKDRGSGNEEMKTQREPKGKKKRNTKKKMKKDETGKLFEINS